MWSLAAALFVLLLGIDAAPSRDVPESNGVREEFASPGDCDPGSPLFLTPLIEAGKVDEARLRSRVTGIPGMNRESYSGLLTVRPEHDAMMFFWFFPAEENSNVAPVVLWMNGGPGSSALGGLFAENGPYAVTRDLRLKHRGDNWGRFANVIYVDTPVGTGYSSVASLDHYCNSSQAVARDVYQVVTQFFSMFAEYADNDFFVNGESYGVKYASWTMKIIHDRNTEATSKVNLKGAILFSGPLKFYQEGGWAEYAFQLGLMDPGQYEKGLAYERRMAEALKAGNNSAVARLFLEYMATTSADQGYFFEGATGITAENVALTQDPYVFTDFHEFVRGSCVRRAIHVGSLEFRHYSQDVIEKLISDFVQDLTGIVGEALQAGSRVLLASGNLDMFVPAVLARRMAVDLEWDGAEAFRRSTRVFWRLDPRDADVAGYANCDGSLCLVLVRNAGHRMPNDQPQAVLDAVERFIFGLPF